MQQPKARRQRKPGPVLTGTEVSTWIRESASKVIVAHPDCLEAVWTLGVAHRVW